MITEFELPDGIEVRFRAANALDVVFQEVRVRGEVSAKHQVVVSCLEDPEVYEFKSWADMQRKYPTMLDFLKHISLNEKWSTKNNHDFDPESLTSLFFIKSVSGNEGLYDLNETVFFIKNRKNKDNEENKQKAPQLLFRGRK